MSAPDYIVYGWVAFILIFGFYPPLRLASMGRRRLGDHVSRSAIVFLLPVILYLFPLVFGRVPLLDGQATWLARAEATPPVLPIVSVALWVAALVLAGVMRRNEQEPRRAPVGDRTAR